MSKRATIVALIVLALVAGILIMQRAREVKREPTQPQRVRMALTAYPDTSLYLYGLDRGYFREQGIQLELLDFPWNEQIEAVAGGGVDIAMATLDEVVAKSRSLTSIGKRVVYFLPAWQFEGTIFVGQRGILPLSDLRSSKPIDQARSQFLDQLRDKLIAVPEGGMYDQALRRFITAAGQKPEQFNLVNAQLETGINALGDPKVGLAAAGAFERPEAERRGYKVALTPSDLDVVILTGYITSARLLETNPKLFQHFAAAWYKTVNAALQDQDAAYAIAKKYLDAHGAKVPPLTDYKAALGSNKFPRLPDEARAAFLSEASPTYWRRAWDNATKALQESGKGDQVPLTYADFAAQQLLVPKPPAK